MDVSSSKELPIITVVISCYNSDDTVERAIRSALDQDWPNLEILVADDGSSDRTAEIIISMTENEDNARALIYDSNKGFAESLNTLIFEAKGEFIAIFDDDDFSVSNRVRLQYERIISYEKTHKTDKIVCHAARLQTYPDGTERYEKTLGTNIDGLAPYGDDVADRILFGKLSPNIVGSCANCSRMARTHVFKQLSGFDKDMRRGEDTDFNIRHARSGGHFVGISEPLVYQTMTLDAEKNYDAEKNAENFILKKHSDYLSKKGWRNFCFLWLDARYYYYKNDLTSFVKALIHITLRYPFKMLKKIYYVMPARSTRRAYKSWHNNNPEIETS